MLDTFTTPSTENTYTPSSIMDMGLRMVEKSDKLLMRGDADLSSVIPNSFDKKARPSPKKRVPWNKGLTKETDERVKRYGVRGGKTRKERYDAGELQPYNKGKTYEDIFGTERALKIKKELSGSHKGKKPWNAGKAGICSKKTLKAMSEAHKGQVPWTKGLKGKGICKPNAGSFKKGHIPWHNGLQRPDIAGPNNYNWKGGYEPYHGPDWGFMNKKARERDGGICYMCNADEKDYPKRFDIHHIEPYRISHDNSLENLMTLCPSCHKKIENITMEA